MTGTLFLVGTPIGNLGDFSPRGLQTLKEVSSIYCESPKVTLKLLRHFGIQVPLFSYSEARREEATSKVIAQLKEGHDIALLSDAGMPVISDPGWYLIEKIHREGLRLEVVPGPTSVVCGLVCSGFASRYWSFEGFLPKSGAQRKKRLKVVAQSPYPVVLLVGPHDLKGLLKDLLRNCSPEREIYLGRELTKRFEEHQRVTLERAWEDWSQKDRAIKGEFVLVLEGVQESVEAKHLDDTLLRELKAVGVSDKALAKILTRLEYGSRKELYQRLISL